MEALRSKFKDLALQVYFLRIWTLLPTAQGKARLDQVRAGYPSLFRSIESSIHESSSFQCGVFLSAIWECANVLAMFFLQHPTRDQELIYLPQLRDFLAWTTSLPMAESTTLASRQFDMQELADFVRDLLTSRPPIADGQSQQAMDATFMPLTDEDVFSRARAYIEKVPFTCIYLLILGSQVNFREHMDYTSFLQVSRGFIRHPSRNPREFAPHPALIFDVHRRPTAAELRRWNALLDTDGSRDDSDDDFEPSGNRIFSSIFCAPLEVGEAPEHAECLICQEPLVVPPEPHMYWDLGPEDSIDFETLPMWNMLPVITECRHAYHQGCLHHWVNLSCSGACNTCPLCRTVMCPARDRRPRAVETQSDYPDSPGQLHETRRMPQPPNMEYEVNWDIPTIPEEVAGDVQMAGPDGRWTDCAMIDHLLGLLNRD